jgi:exosome complex RNA-binding protein Csl4
MNDFLKYIQDDAALQSLETLREANAAIAAAFKLQQMRNAIQFHHGQEVSFVSKMGFTVYGRVTKINRQTIMVKTERGLFRVSPSMLKEVA